MNNKQNKELLIQTISLTNNLNLLETTEQQTAKWSWGKSEAFLSQLVVKYMKTLVRMHNTCDSL